MVDLERPRRSDPHVVSGGVLAAEHDRIAEHRVPGGSPRPAGPVCRIEIIRVVIEGEQIELDVLAGEERGVGKRREAGAVEIEARRVIHVEREDP